MSVIYHLCVPQFLTRFLGQNHIFTAVGVALALDGRTLVYGGGSKGIMGIVSGSVLENDGKVIGVIPRAMVAAGGENEKVASSHVYLDEVGRETVPYIFFKATTIKLTFHPYV